jgi:hypothetical protein
MKLDFARVQKLLKAFDFPTLFREELGWEPIRYTLDVQAENETYHLETIAHKRGFFVLWCNGQIPSYAIRLKIDSRVAKSYHEHLIIYTDHQQTTQVWQWVKRQIGKPIASRRHIFHREQSGTALIQKLEHLAVTLDDEERLTILDVAEGVRSGFDVERVTKRFYDRFKDEHAAFLKFVGGIPEEGMQRWYVSVTLNRLMFVYFIQKKGFLDGDPDYLRCKLAESRKQGNDRFYTDFLCPLFFQGFAHKEHDTETVRLLGQVPFLNGGIFARHQIEELYGEKLQIPDKAFERLFAFFEDYQWHLDERPMRRDNEINPDVLGYIFEKYINQKQMGAYYTKEDITGYISKNTVIPHLFDAARALTPRLFNGEGSSSIWKLLQENPDRYIYEAVRKGVDLPLPPEIAAGIADVSKRSGWNVPAPEEFALPTEIWREVVNRRQRYEEVRGRLASGQVRDVNDLITYNLDIRQFAQDVIENAESPELLRAFLKAIRGVTVLDPTVGSGAFLFAALNILEPLYEACLERMGVFVEELDASGEPHRPEKFSDFRKVLAEVGRHPNRRYFVLKSIIINNLYGVDIMDEAVEICKLRLFLKLVAQVERVEQIEPLPDIDFNIRAGNTLVGFAAKDDVRRAVEMTNAGQLKLVSSEDSEILRSIEEKAEAVDRLFGLFRQQQTELGGEVRPEDKTELRRRLKELEDELNIHMARQYGIHNYKSAEFTRWRESHKPFHWFIEFYGIMREGGFDVIIGNPPYVELNKVRDEYSLQGYATESCGNLYALMLERFSKLEKSQSYSGLIVPLSIVCTSRMAKLREIVYKNYANIWLNNYDTIPCTLFSGIVQRNTIFIGNRFTRKKDLRLFGTQLQKWYAEERSSLFQLIPFVSIIPHKFELTIPKISTSTEEHILRKIESQKISLIQHTVRSSNNSINYKRRWSYYLLFADKVKNLKLPNGSFRDQQDVKTLSFKSDLDKYVFVSVLSSGLFYFYYSVYADFRHVNISEFETFKFNYEKLNKDDLKILSELAKRLMKSYEENLEWRECNYVGSIGICTVPFYRQGNSKPIMDEIDRALACHYGLTAEELDFIINYDIKYRMGSELEEGVE